jgi:hypothetical protein
MISIGFGLYLITALLWWLFSYKVSLYRKSKKKEKISDGEFLLSMLNLILCPLAIIMAMFFIEEDFREERKYK